MGWEQVTEQDLGDLEAAVNESFGHELNAALDQNEPHDAIVELVRMQRVARRGLTMIRAAIYAEKVKPRKG